MNKLWQKIVAALVAAVAAGISGFYLFAADVNLSLVAPTQNTDGSALTDLASVRFYKSVLPPNGDCAAVATVYSVLVTKAATPGAVVGTIDANQIVSGRYCYKATAIDTAGNESAFSNIAFKDIDVLFPKAPTGLTAN